MEILIFFIHNKEKRGKNMPYVNTKTILDYAKTHKFAHGAFNVNTLCQAKAIIEACEELRCAAIIQVAEPGLAFIGGNVDFLNGTFEDKKIGAKRIAKYVKQLAEKSSVPVSLHLDHGRSYESCKLCLDSGFNSVMFDGSAMPYEQNVEITKKVVLKAHQKGASVEAELGVLSGVEDNVFASNSTYTNPVTALDFVEKTGVDLLAISYGTKHGAAKGDNVVLRKEIVTATLENLAFKNIDCIIVSHGSSMVPQNIVSEIRELGGTVKGSGIPLNELKEAIKAGISKINIDTDIRLATTRNILEYFRDHPEKQKDSKIYPLLKEKPDSFEYRYYLKDYINELETNKNIVGEIKEIIPLMEKAAKEIVLRSTIEFGSQGDAPYILKTYN